MVTCKNVIFLIKYNFTKDYLYDYGVKCVNLRNFSNKKPLCKFIDWLVFAKIGSRSLSTRHTNCEEAQLLVTIGDFDLYTVVGSYRLLYKHSLLFFFLAVNENNKATDDAEMVVESSSGKELTTNGVLEAEGHLNMEPYVGMEFESEEAAKAYYSTYATHLGFIMRVDAFRRSMRNGELVWRRLVCNKEGFSKSRQSQSGKRKCRAIREGCKAMIIVKKEQSGKWVVAKLVKEHNHPLIVKPVNTRKGAILCQTPDDKDVKIRELAAELQKERKRSAALQEQLDMVLIDMEDHSEQLSKNISDIVKSVKELESRKTVFQNGG